MESQFDKYFTNKLTESEKLAFLKEVEADPALLDEFIEMQNSISLSSLLSQDYDEAVGEASFQEFENKQIKIKRRKFIRVAAQYAAILIVAILGTWYGSKHFYWNAVKPNFTEIIVPQGHRAEVVLDDGTKVWLNSRSRLKYPSNFLGSERVVTLDGDALFDVVENKDKPFVVKTSRYNVKVLGTIFNVFNYSESPVFEATLLEGKVCVEKENARDGMILRPNEKAFMHNGVLEKVEMREQNINLWQNGVVVFNNIALKDIILKLELYYNVRFTIRNEKALPSLYTGRFSVVDPIENILDAIQNVQKFEYTMSSDKKIIYID